jgi:molybdopterin-guanine dinucleotide biosynthesis protein A
MYFHTKEKYDAIVPIVDNKIQPLCAIYNITSINILKKLHKNKSYKLQDFLKKINTKFIICENKKEFININYFDEYLKYNK